LFITLGLRFRLGGRFSLAGFKDKHKAFLLFNPYLYCFFKFSGIWKFYALMIKSHRRTAHTHAISLHLIVHKKLILSKNAFITTNNAIIHVQRNQKQLTIQVKYKIGKKL